MWGAISEILPGHRRGRRCTSSRTENLLCADESDLGRRGVGQVWNDSADAGFRIVGATRTVIYTLAREDRDRDGELHSTFFTPCDERGGALTGLPNVVLFND